MGGEKGGTKSGGFFNLFDWNRKSRKKLFSSNSPDSMKQEKKGVDNLAMSHLRLVDEDEIVGVSSAKGSSDYSCASSVTDEEGIMHRAPGVVARLMGLDSMPTSGVSEPSSTPFYDTRSLRDKQSLKRSPEFCITDQFNQIGVHRVEGYVRRPIESRSQKMPSSPIERFQTETIPPRLSKTLPLTHHKLLSPIKNPGFISAKNAAHIMEAAAKILDSENQPSSRAKISSFGPSSIPLRIRESKENMSISQFQRTSRVQESSARTGAVESTDVRYLRGKHLNRSWNGSDYSDNTPDVKAKGKSISLAIQAKVNVQRREGLSSSSRNNTSVQKEQHDECKLNQPFKSQPSNQKNKQQKKQSGTTTGVLRQNNQKQNCMLSKGKSSSKQSMSNQHGRKVHAGDSSTSTKNKALNKLSGNSRTGEREGLSASNKDFPRKKRMIEGGFIEKCVQPNVVIDEHSYSKWKEDNRSDGADVVSFTFTSPLVKPLSGSHFSSPIVENLDKGDMYCFDTHNQKKDEESSDKKFSSHGLNVISGDALSLLLEQKLRELTSGVEPSYGNILSAMDTIGTATAENEKEVQQSQHRDKSRGVFGYGASSINGQVYGASKLQGLEECSSSSSDARKELDHQHPSPFSILEASFSMESYNSTESSFITDAGRKTCSSSIQAQNNLISNSVPESEMELLDSASSTLTETSDASELGRTSFTKSSHSDLDYVNEILSSSASASNHLSELNPNLFNKLEDKRRGENRDGILRRKVLFDCVNECMDLKCKRYFQAGYSSWSKGKALVIENENLAKDVYDEISGWKSMGDWMVDEIVESDMSSHLGKWVNYDIEAFEAGMEIENDVVNSLVDEVIEGLLDKRRPLLIEECC